MQNERTTVVCIRAGIAPRPMLLLLTSLLLAFTIILSIEISEQNVSVSYAAEREDFPVERNESVMMNRSIEIEEVKVESINYNAQASSNYIDGKVSSSGIDRTIEEEVVVLTKLYHYDEETYITMAKMLSGECGGVESMTERSGCGWIACNRVLDPRYPDTIIAVITAEGQFTGYSPYNTYTEADYELAVDILERFYQEQHGATALEVGRTLPADYLYFHGDGKHNYFKKTIHGDPYVFGSDELVSPYMN